MQFFVHFLAHLPKEKPDNQPLFTPEKHCQTID